MTRTDLGRRVASAVVGVPLVVLAIWLGGLWFLAAVLALALLSVAEFQRMVGLHLRSPLGILSLALAGVIMANAWQGGDHTLPVLTVALLLSLSLGLVQARANMGLPWALSLVSLLYPAWLLGYFLLLRGAPQGREWVLLAVLCTFSVDTVAYFAGRAFGRHKMVPRISPGKSWEGTGAGLVAGALAALVLARLLGLEVAALSGLALGLALGIAAVMGDLAESGLKRSFQVKDAGHLIPGHGGLLDRLDSLLFTIVVVYYYRAWLGA
ncbi:MAG: CDP-archaeol synthase [Chloroflexi bacterium]|nr:CDP-archaeol synthase [Chloroflexota bacterium]